MSKNIWKKTIEVLLSTFYEKGLFCVLLFAVSSFCCIMRIEWQNIIIIIIIWKTNNEYIANCAVHIYVYNES